MKILVCGGRHYGNMAEVVAALDMLEDVTLVIHGDAAGADKLGREWAARKGIHYAAVPALWGQFGKAAGMKRNAAMLQLEPEMVVAFPGGTGTANMVRLADKAGITVWKPYG